MSGSVRLRKKKKCGRCPELADFPYIHCKLEQEIACDYPKPNVFSPKPKDPESCREARQLQLSS